MKPSQGDALPPDQIFAPGTPFPAAHALPSAAGPKYPAPGRGRRSQSVAAGRAGYTIGAARPGSSISDIAVAGTLRAAALRRAVGNEEVRRRGGEENVIDSAALHPAPIVLRSDLRVKVRRARTGNLILFVVDASGSMGARKRMVAVKGAILSLLLNAYQKRDRVGLITFRGQTAEVLVPPTNSIELAERSLRQMPTGGQTPLAAGLRLARQTLALHLKHEAALSPLLVLVTDGRANVGQATQIQQAAVGLWQLKLAALVLDSEQGFLRLGAAPEIATWLGADYVRLDDLRSETITQRVRQQLNPWDVGRRL